MASSLKKVRLCEDSQEEVTTVSGPESVPVDFEIHDLLSHLLRRAHFHAESEFSEVYGNLEATSRQLALLFTINRMPGSSQTQLAEAVGVDLNTLSDLAKRSERKNLLKRVRSDQDQRAFHLYLTEEGKAMVALAAVVTPAYQARIAQRLSASESSDLVRLLRKMLGLS